MTIPHKEQMIPFDDTSCCNNELSEERNSRTTRREFLKRIGFVGITFAISSKIPLAASSEPVFDESDSAKIWRDRVTGFVFSICDSKKAAVITSRLARARIDLAPASTNFHDSFSAPLIFSEPRIDPEEVICGNGFEVNRYPFYDVKCPCRNVNDLNAFEIRRIVNVREIERYGCVLAPASARTAMDTTDEILNYRTTMSEYRLDPKEFAVLYKRLFTGKGESYWGFHIAHKTEVGASGKPLRDLLLSSTKIRH